MMSAVPPPRPEPPRSLRRPGAPAAWLQIALAFGVLTSGIAIGACGVVVFGRDALLRRALGAPEMIPGQVMDRIGADLRLTPEQAAEVQAAIAKRMARVDEIRSSSRDEIRSEFDGLREDVAALLDADRARLWRQRFEEARHAGYQPPPPPEPGRWQAPPGAGPRPGGEGMPPAPAGEGGPPPPAGSPGAVSPPPDGPPGR